jgi:Uma2 family endonuclease
MTTIAPAARLTPDDLLRLEAEGLFELVDGKLIEKHTSFLTSETAGLVAGALLAHTQRGNLGRVLPEASFRCFPNDSERVRRPDVAFIAASNVPRNLEEAYITVPPDLAVEVVSPNDRIYELEEKLDDYRSASVKLVWVINPNSRVVRVYRPDHQVLELFDGDTLHGEPVLVGFAVQVRDLLPKPPSGLA